MSKFVIISDDINFNLRNMKFKPVKNREVSNIPVEGTGIWASKYKPRFYYTSKFHEILINNFSKEPQVAFKFELNSDAKICVIDSLEDLYLLISDFNINVDYLRRGMTLNFEKLSEMYDALYLTEQGQEETFDSYGVDLSGWYPETLLLFNMECIDTDSIDKIYL